MRLPASAASAASCVRLVQELRGLSRATKWMGDARESCVVQKKGGHWCGWRHEEVTWYFQPQQHLVCDTSRAARASPRHIPRWKRVDDGKLCAVRKKEDTGAAGGMKK